jgi:hypothetical protein
MYACTNVILSQSRPPRPDYGQFAFLNGPATSQPCLVAFGAQNGGTYFLSSQDQVNGGCGN